MKNVFMKKILVVDNYDSFTYNLVYLLRRHADITVKKNDQVTFADAEQFHKILFSPGPGIPAEAGNMCALIKHFAGVKPILGVCLGHQAIGQVFGGTLQNLDKVYHGIATPVILNHRRNYLFNNVPETFLAGRYHSWVVDSKSIPHDLEVTACDNDGMIMALAHKVYDINGLQFHPESIMTEYGETMIQNWVNQ